MVVLAIAGGFAGGFASKAMAQDHRPMMSDADKGARMDKHIERMVKHMAIELDATPEQQTKLIAIAKGAIKDMAPMHEKRRAAHQRGVALLSAAQVDRAALEQLRVEQIATADSSSKRLVQALADAAEVLTPPQRQKLAEHMKKMGEGMRGRMGGRMGGMGMGGDMGSHFGGGHG